MCGNFGLLKLLKNYQKSHENDERVKVVEKMGDEEDNLDASLHRSMHEVSRLHGIRVATDIKDEKDENNLLISEIKLISPVDVLSPATILHSQTVATEIRGGQAGGISTFEYNSNKNTHSSNFEAQFGNNNEDQIASVTRVRCVARKRFPLADDLADKFVQADPSANTSADNNILTSIGHTRFATSSVNVDSELHPHEWVPFRDEQVWKMNEKVGRFERMTFRVGHHITHNGDFDALNIYNETILVNDLGLWLERILHVSNFQSGDSPKIAGCMDLFCVQGRWSAAARLAYVRCILKHSGEVATSGDIQAPLSNESPNACPNQDYWEDWALFLETVWMEHVHNIIKQTSLAGDGRTASSSASRDTNDKLAPKAYGYHIDRVAELQCIDCMKAALDTDGDYSFASKLHGSCRHSLHEWTSTHGTEADSVGMKYQGKGGVWSSLHGSFHGGPSTSSKPTRTMRDFLGASKWSDTELYSFIRTAMKGFLRSDMYNALVEILSRAEGGSFGLQVHNPSEPGVVVIASRGQPMSLSFHPSSPVCLFGSEAEAVAVPVQVDGQWLSERLDLDSNGEVVRIGAPRLLYEGSFTSQASRRIDTSNHAVLASELTTTFIDNKLLLDSGIEIKSYSLVNHSEMPSKLLLKRCVGITTCATISAPYTGSTLFSRNFPAVTELVSFWSHEMERVFRGCVAQQDGYKVPVDIENESPINDLPSDPCDLVGNDLAVTPAVLSAIDRAWLTKTSVEYISGQSLTIKLIASMKQKSFPIASPSNTGDGYRSFESVDLLIAGVEASLWMAEQWCNDVRAIFPHLRVVTTSSNKLLGLGSSVGGDSQSVLFNGSFVLQPDQHIDKHTCVLLISQSGQTFPTLHSTRALSRLVKDRLWILTGCFNSKMELAMTDCYKAMGLTYGKNRVFNNYSGHRPAEPSSVAVAATSHSLTRLLMHMIETTRKECPGNRIVHRWEYDQHVNIIIAWWRSKRLNGGHLIEAVTKAKAPIIAVSTLKQVKAVLSPSKTSKTDAKSSNSNTPAIDYRLRNPYVFPPCLMKLSDGSIADMESLLRTSLIQNVSAIVGYEATGRKLDSSPKPSGLLSVLMPGLHSMLSADAKVDSTHLQLIKQGELWGGYVAEFWKIQVFVGTYIVVSVALGLPLFGCIASIVVAILQVAAPSLDISDSYVLQFSPRNMHLMQEQPVVWSVVGLAIQLLDAVLIIYCGRYFTQLYRLYSNSPSAARPGRRSLVIVDLPWVHQMVESFVSKLYSQSYSFCGIDVHGASGLDHFVHRFTHRVVRGVLIAVGRPDGRLTSLAKTEAAVMLACKQAAFIQNPDYDGKPGAGPDFVTVGHNPHAPNLGSSYSHIVLPGTRANGSTTGSDTRRKFMDEYIFERLCTSKKPNTSSLLGQLTHAWNTENKMDAKVGSPYLLAATGSTRGQGQEVGPTNSSHLVTTFLPYGCDNIDPQFSHNYTGGSLPVEGAAGKGAINDDPSSRLVFISRLDSGGQDIHQQLGILQQFYECRIAALERYMSFCVIFHAMAKKSHAPWFRRSWNFSRSQSNLRIATTASPVSAPPSADHSISLAICRIIRIFMQRCVVKNGNIALAGKVGKRQSNVRNAAYHTYL